MRTNDTEIVVAVKFVYVISMVWVSLDSYRKRACTKSIGNGNLTEHFRSLVGYLPRQFADMLDYN